MDIETAKRIALDDFLESLGHSSVRRKGNVLWYLSPLREERTASFKVDIGLNCWYDFGLGRGGGIIALARELYRSNDIKYLLECIGRSAPGSIRRFVPNVKKQELPPVFSDISVVPLHSTALLTYLRERKIDTNVARNECVEVHYACNCKRYYAIGFRNRSGGYELRNRWFKGCIAPKDISYIKSNAGKVNATCLVFEGFINYLSFLTLKNTVVCNALVQWKVISSSLIPSRIYARRCKYYKNTARRCAYLTTMRPAVMRLPCFTRH